MKKYFIYLYLLLSGAVYTGCDYLDIVPDERAEESDIWKDKDAALRMLYSCYSYMPKANAAAGSLDFMTGDEVVTAFEHETFANFPKGNFTASNPVISYWNTLYGGIRQAYILLKNIDRVPNIAENRDEFVAEAEFLIAYYHMLLMRCYGPIIIVDHEVDIDTDPSQYLGRSTLEQTVNFIVGQFDKVIKSSALPDVRKGVEVGRATKTAAMALKAYTLMYYASPLFNGNADLAAKLINKDGSEMMSPAYDKKRWEAARDAYKAALDACKAAGFELYNSEALKFDNKYPDNNRLRVLRGNLITKVKYNKEEIWTMNSDEGPYGLQKKSMPFISSYNYNGVAPTLTMIRRFYTKNGLPYDVDPETKTKKELEVVTLTKDNASVSFADGTKAVIAKEGKQTSQLNLLREPRYYAWIAFQNGFYEIQNDSYKPGYKKEEMDEGQRLITDFTKNGNCGRQDRNNDYSPTGFLNKKGIHIDNMCANNNITFQQYPWPLIRLAELYLGYAECLAECGDAQGAMEAINPIRERAGIPTVQESWSKVGVTPDAKKMVEIVRQERQIELYLENQNFWDMRRWKLADKYFGVKAKGLNIDGVDVAGFSKETEVPFSREFREWHWLLPIPDKDINNNHNVVQNPGY